MSHQHPHASSPGLSQGSSTKSHGPRLRLLASVIYLVSGHINLLPS